MMENLRDLLYQRVSNVFILPVSGVEEGKKINTDHVFKAIVKKTDIQDALAKKMYSGAKLPIEKFLENVDTVVDFYQRIVRETASTRETGRAVGWGLEPHLKKLIPQDLVGGRQNKTKLLKNIRRTLLFGKDDVITDNFLMDGLDVLHVKWLKVITSVRLKQNVFMILVKWLWLVAKRMISSAFYVSEIQGASNQLVYIPKMIWKAETDKAFNTFTHLQPLTESDGKRITNKRKPARLRWVPKQVGLRPLLFVRGDKKVPEVINAKKLLFSLLDKCHLQSSVNYLHRIWRSLVDLREKGNDLYFVVCDVCDAYGSINQEKLIELLEEEIRRKFGVSGIYGYGEEIGTIMGAVNCQTVKMTSKYYHLTKGLAQGMSLSGPLCNLYLKHMDRKCLAEFTSDPDDRLVRAVDDYMYITTSKERARGFLNKMSTGFPEYGMKINTSKTQTNLEGDLELVYNGYIFDTSSLQVYPRYLQGIKTNFRNSMCFKKAPISLLEEKLVKMPLMKLNRLTLDIRYMSIEGVAYNVLCTACVLARRMTAILTLTPAGDIPTGHRLADVVSCCADAVAARVYIVGANLVRDAQKMESGCGKLYLCLLKEEIRWIVVRGFKMVLSQCDKIQIPDDTVTLVTELEEATETHVRSKVLNIVRDIVNVIPAQFRNIEQD